MGRFHLAWTMIVEPALNGLTIGEILVSAKSLVLLDSNFTNAQRWQKLLEFVWCGGILLAACRPNAAWIISTHAALCRQVLAQHWVVQG